MWLKYLEYEHVGCAIIKWVVVMHEYVGWLDIDIWLSESRENLLVVLGKIAWD